MGVVSGSSRLSGLPGLGKTQETASQSHPADKHGDVESNFDQEQFVHIETIVHVQVIVNPPVPR